MQEFYQQKARLHGIIRA
jgi:chromosome segregation ATPase